LSIDLHDIPGNWEWNVLDDVLSRFESGNRPKGGVSDINDGIPSIGGEHLTDDGGFDFSNIKYVPEDFYEGMNQGKIEKGDVLMVKDGATTGKTSFVRDNFPFDRAAVNSHVFLFRPTKKLNNKYLFYYLYSGFGQNFVDENLSGTTQGGINLSFSDNTYIPIPPLNEQEQIVKKIEEIITKLNAGEKELRNSKSQLETYQKLLLKFSIEGKLTNEWREDHELKPSSTLLKEIKNSEELVNKRWRNKLENIDESNLMDLPEIWEWTRIGKISNNIHYGYTESACDEKVGPKFLRITDIQDNKVDWKNVPFCEIEESKKSKYLLNKGDIVFARTGGTVGKNYLIKGDIPEAVFASYLIRIKLNKRAHPKYISYFFRTQRYWKQIYEGKIGIGQPNVNATKLSKIKVPLPPLEEQIKIAQILEGKTSIIDNLFNYIERNMKKTNILRQSFLKEAFRGNIISRNKINNLREKPLDRTNEEQKQERLDNYAE